MAVHYYYLKIIINPLLFYQALYDPAHVHLSLNTNHTGLGIPEHSKYVPTRGLWASALRAPLPGCGLSCLAGSISASRCLVNR